VARDDPRDGPRVEVEGVAVGQPDEDRTAVARDGAPRLVLVRRALALVVVLALAGAALLRPDPGPTPLLGRLDVRPGASSTEVPDPLEVVRWRVEAPGAVAARGAEPLGVPAGPDHVALVGGRVVRIADGSTTRVGAPTLPAPDGRELRLEGGDLVELEAATGRFVRRTPLRWDGPTSPRVLLGRAGDGVLVMDLGGDWGLVAPDGSTRWVAPRAARPPERGVVADRHVVVPTRDGTGLHVAVDVTDGTEAGRFAPLRTTEQPLVVPGGEVATALQGTQVVAWALPGGDELWRRPLLSGPGQLRLLVAPGRVVAAVSNLGVPGPLVSLAPEDGEVQRVVPVSTRPTAPAGGSLVAVTARSAYTAAGDGQSVLATDWPDDEPRWQTRLDDVRAVEVVAGGVVVLHGTSGREQVRLLDPDDGTVLATVAPPTDRPVAGLGDSVVLAPDGLPTPVRRATAVRLSDGALRPLEEALERDDDLPRDTSLVGLGDDGAPVLLRERGDDDVVVLGPDGAEVGLELPRTRGLAAPFPRAVGSVDGRLVLGLRDEEAGTDVLGLADPATGVVELHRGLRPLVVAGGLVLAVSDGVLVAFRPDTATVAWRAPAEVVPGVAVEAVAAGDLLVLASRDGIGLQALRQDDGTAAWASVLEAPVLAGPVRADGAVVHVGADGVVRATSLTDGRPAWAVDLGATSVTSAGGVVVVGTADGVVVALGADGTERDRLAVGTDAVVHVTVVGSTVLAVVGGDVVGIGVDDGTLPDRDVVELS